ncbi:fucose permease [Stackebrandtia albiflava]|uniref:Fucose permease n=1 Tax=Stackebrandtia albiflava TaxID=406432 RepID=A0A562V3T6_9ACTN|nr:MFS transporter [Stackebrandtia albiflava]TWJ12551.1 fucose permease [Stackebrandtia albiflava]
MLFRFAPRAAPRLRRARLGVFGYFAVSGLTMGCWAAGLPALDERLSLGPGRLGNVLLLIAAGALVSMLFTGRACDRFTSRAITRFAGPVNALALIAPVLADSYGALAVAAFGYGLTLGAIEIAMNVNSIEVESSYGRPIVSAFHGLWSLGGAVGGGLTALGNHLGADPQALLVTVAVLSAGLFLYFGIMLLPPPAAPAAVTPEGAARARTGGLRWGVVILLGVVAFSGYVSEGAAIDWASVHARRVLDADLAVAPIAYTVFGAAMTIVRLLGDPIRGRLGSAKTLALAGAMAAAGYTLVLVSPWAGGAAVAVACLGWLLTGSGLATVVPVVFSAVGANGGSVGKALSTVTAFGSAGLLIGPGVIGQLAEATSLPTALMVPAGLAVVVAVFGPPAIRALTGGRSDAIRPGATTPDKPVGEPVA